MRHVRESQEPFQGRPAVPQIAAPPLVAAPIGVLVAAAAHGR